MQLESVVVISENVDDIGIEKLSRKIKEFINTIGRITSVEDKGKMKLAYEIRKNKFGHYIVYNFEVENKKAIKILDAFYKKVNEILRYITVEVNEI